MKNIFFNNNLRVGIGFDIHRFKSKRKLFLGGVNIPYKKGLEGHSDGDVLIHSIIDAILGACLLPDIGELFPDNDVKYKNINSVILLEKVLKLLKDLKIKIINIDSVIVTDEPNISKYKKEIKENLSKIIGIKNINLKGKRTEGIFFKNGIAVWTTVLVKV